MPKEDEDYCYGSVDLIGAIRRSKSPVTTANKMAAAMISTENTKESHFPEGARLASSCLDLLVATDKSLPESMRNKRSSWGLFTDQVKFADALEAMLESDIEFLRDQANSFLDVAGDDREMRGIKSTMRVQCSPTFSEPMPAKKR